MIKRKQIDEFKKKENINRYKNTFFLSIYCKIKKITI